MRTSYPESLEDDVPPRALHLPPNLYVIGTVNMDETTHAFSPKVLDRAFTIELTEVDFASYDLGMADAATAPTDDEKAALLRAFSREGRFVRIDKGGDIAGVVDRHPVIHDLLQSLNLLLRRDRFHFGYRVFDEIGQYLAINDEHQMMPFEDAFDQAVLMKVLPKFSGSRARLRSPVLSVLTWAIDPGRTGREDIESAVTQFDSYYVGTATDSWTAPPIFPVVASRARDMLVTLERDGFVSFG
jgi:5-methylcytosine-specific restriction endonuclease McrBC GTP-binding regulatory subunit McrB